MADERLMNGWETDVPAIQNTFEYLLQHMIPGVQRAEEKVSYWTNGENVGDLDVSIKEVFLLPFRIGL